MTAYWTTPVRDKYGRPAIYLQNSGTKAALVTLPKTYVAEYGDRYLVNVWANPNRDDAVRYFVNRREAKQWAETEVARFTA